MQIKTIEPFEIIGFSTKSTFSDDGRKTSLLWQKFLPLKMTNNLLAKENVYSVSKPLDANFSFENKNSKVEKIIGINASSEKLAIFDSFMIDGGQYGIFCHRGRADRFSETLKTIVTNVLPSEGYTYDKMRNRFEILTVDYCPTDENATETIWVPIKKFKF